MEYTGQGIQLTYSPMCHGYTDLDHATIRALKVKQSVFIFFELQRFFVIPVDFKLAAKVWSLTLNSFVKVSS